MLVMLHALMDTVLGANVAGKVPEVNVVVNGFMKKWKLRRCVNRRTAGGILVSDE